MQWTFINQQEKHKQLNKIMRNKRINIEGETYSQQIHKEMFKIISDQEKSKLRSPWNAILCSFEVNIFLNPFVITECWRAKGPQDP